MNKHIQNNNNKGQSLFELLVAVVVIGVTLVSIVGLAVKVIGNTTFSRNQTLANRYTQDLLEWVRSERDKDWNQINNRSSAAGRNWCFATSPIATWPTEGACGANQVVTNTRFRRQAVLRTTAANVIEVTITTRWDEPSGAKEVSSVSILSNWRGNL